ncbi:MAG: hypothetical protein ACKOXZ_08805, partial [Polynucleobacter victoriensis]
LKKKSGRGHLTVLIICIMGMLSFTPTDTSAQLVTNGSFESSATGIVTSTDVEGWLILSDLAEHLGLRTRAELLEWIDAAGLSVLGRNDVRPTHAKALDKEDPLYRARAAEVTSLWRLGAVG